MNEGLTLKTGQTHMKRYPKPPLEKLESGEIKREGERLEWHGVDQTNLRGIALGLALAGCTNSFSTLRLDS
jgi:hypothetical protein